ncbi:MAG: efflux RND transporter permease subunit [Betaproteobacteria bacterium]
MGRFLEFILRPRARAVVLLGCFLMAAAGIWAAMRASLDAVPDVSDRQVIVYVNWSGQDPEVIQNQVTYPIVTTMLHVPQMRSVRGYSSFGFSLVYVLLHDDVDLYWARSRILEYLDQIRSTLPSDPNLTVGLGPDATGVGWVYEYALTSERRTLTELRTLQDWYLRYGLQSVAGVAEVASVGGAVKEYQVSLDPDRLRAYGIPLDRVLRKVEASNVQQSGRWIEAAGSEYLIRGLGYIRSPADLANIVLKADESGVPVTIGDVGRIVTGMQERRGAVDLDGRGQTVGGIVVARIGADVASVVRDVKAKLDELRHSLPEDVRLVPVYDRAKFIDGSLEAVRSALGEELVVVVLVVILFLMDVRGALVVLLPLPIALLGAVFMLKAFGVAIDIMALSGMAIAVGTMVDAVIVVVENAHKHLERAPPGSVDTGAARTRIVVASLREVAAPILVSMAIVILGFLPVLLLSGEEGRLFRPLVLSKSFAVLCEMVLVALLVPILMTTVLGRRVKAEDASPINRGLMRIYRRCFVACMNHRRIVAVVTLAVGASAGLAYLRLGSEFMPPVYEGDVMYMPTTLPAVSITEMEQVVQRQNRLLKGIPEVQTVFGKVGRADTATDPAPLSMIETVIQLKPRSQWRAGLTEAGLVHEMDELVKVPGLTNAWTMPIRGRIDMLSTGIRTPLGIKVYGPDYRTVDRVAEQIRAVLAGLPGTRNVFADKATLGRYFDLTIDRELLKRYDLAVEDVQRTIRYGIGGDRVGTTVEGLERYPITVRYQADARSTPQDMLKYALVYSPNAGYIPLDYVATGRIARTPTEIKTENGMPVDYVYVDPAGSDIGGYARTADREIRRAVKLPSGVYYQWSGQYEGIERTHASLAYVVPVVAVTIAVLYYLLYGSAVNAALVLLSVPFSLVGAFWLMALLGYDVSIASIVGMIALAGICAQTTVVMLVYLDIACDKARREGRLAAGRPLFDAVYEGAVTRLRPKTMTVLAVILSLLPILLTHGVGADVAKRIAAPMIGGMVSSALLVLLVVPVLYSAILERRLRRAAATP